MSGYFFIKFNNGLTINEVIKELFPPILTFPFSNVIYFENMFLVFELMGSHFANGS